MKVLTLHQPYASAAVEGIKQWETRTGPPAGDMAVAGVRSIPGARINRGERILIHGAAKRLPIWWEAMWRDGERPPAGHWLNLPGADRWDDGGESPDGDWWGHVFRRDLFGVILGSVEVVDAVCIRTCWDHLDDDGDGIWVEGSPGNPTGLVLVDRYLAETSIDAQLPWGDWQEGRWALLLANPLAFARPIPAKGRQGVWTTDIEVPS